MKYANNKPGNVHIVLDGSFVKKANLIYWRDRAVKNNDVDNIVLAEWLLQMTKTQRNKVVNGKRNETS